jgi:hypothetical protein
VRQIHLAAVDDGLERGARQPEVTHGHRELAGDGMLDGAPVVAACKVRPPAGKIGALDRGVGAEVRDVVDGAAEGVDGVEGVATMPRKREECEEEVRAALARDLRAETGETHTAPRVSRA